MTDGIRLPLVIIPDGSRKEIADKTLALKAPSFFALCPEPKLAPVSGERREVGAAEAETRHDVQREALPGLSPPCAAHLPAVGRVGRSPNLTRGSKEGLVKREALPWHSGGTAGTDVFSSC